MVHAYSNICSFVLFARVVLQSFCCRSFVRSFVRVDFFLCYDVRMFAHFTFRSCYNFVAVALFCCLFVHFVVLCFVVLFGLFIVIFFNFLFVSCLFIFCFLSVWSVVFFLLFVFLASGWFVSCVLFLLLFCLLF